MGFLAYVLLLVTPLVSGAIVNLRLTSSTYPDYMDLTTKCKDLYGPDWNVAEATDLWALTNLQLIAVLDVCYEGGAMPVGMSGFVTYNGNSHYFSNRRYYATRHNLDHTTSYYPSNFDVILNINNHILDVGAWAGSRRILCEGPVDSPCGAFGHNWSDKVPEVCYQNVADACACETLCLTLYNAWMYDDANLDSVQCCCWSSI